MVVVGDLMTDVVVLLQEQFAPESDTASEITIGPGGSGSNVAVFLVRGGVAAALVGAVGDDDRGQALVDALVARRSRRTSKSLAAATREPSSRS